MDYYEELGLSRSASVSDIRQAYKQLVRLLHPDHCPDEAAKRMAELQMKRLNGILEILTDPAERAYYDSGKPAAPVAQLAGRGSKRNWQWLWATGGALGVLLLLAFIRQPQPRVAQSPDIAPAAAAVAAAATSQSPLMRPRRAITARIQPPPEDAPEIGTPEELPSVASSGSAIEEYARPTTVSRDILTASVKTPFPDIERSSIRPSLAGDWFFVPSTRTRNDGLYPPQYIELHISQNDGMVRGRYRASYRVPDRAISPDVSFQFEGLAGRDGANLTWTGAGGASGDLTLRLLTSSALEITWVANQLGSEMGLISGTSTLIRKAE
jgi:hypothetical protein